jgi:single-strand DNA-binding protein
MNKVILIGRLTRDPEIRYLTNGVAVTNFTIAVNRPFLNQQGEREADFIKIVVWRKLAEHCAANLNKGRLVGVCGRLQIRTYDDESGQRRWITEVVADEVKFLEWPKDRPDRSEEYGAAGPDAIGETLDDLPF